MIGILLLTFSALTFSADTAAADDRLNELIRALHSPYYFTRLGARRELIELADGRVIEQMLKILKSGHHGAALEAGEVLLGRIDDVKADELVEAVGGAAGPGAAKRALEIITATGKKTARTEEFAISLLGSDDPSVRAQAIRTCGVLVIAQADALRPLFSDGFAEVRQAAIAAAEGYPFDVFLTEIGGAFGDFETAIRLAATRSVAVRIPRGDDRLTDKLGGNLRSENAELVVATIDALGAVGTRRAFELLLKIYISTYNVRYRGACFRQFKNFGNEIVGVVAGYLDDPNPSVQKKALDMLANFQESEPYILRYLEKNLERLKSDGLFLQDIHRILQRVTGKTIGPGPDVEFYDWHRDARNRILLEWLKYAQEKKKG